MSAITPLSLSEHDATFLAHMFLVNFFAEHLHFQQVGWEASVQSHFQISPEMLNGVHVWARAGSFQDIHSCPETTALFF